MTVHPHVASASEKRRTLRDAMKDLEAVTSSPSAAEDWLARVGARLDAFLGALHAHIDDVEGPQGLLAQIVDEAPRLSAECDTFRTDHVAMVAATEAVKTAVENADQGASDDIADIRDRVQTILHDLVEHRQRGSDLVYDAYNVDIAAGD